MSMVIASLQDISRFSKERGRASASRRCDVTSKKSGFTLVELLVVLLIIGLGFSMASLNIGGSSSFELQSEAKFFANRLALISEEAVLSREQWGVDVYRETGDDGEYFGYRWLILDDNKQWLLANRNEQPGEFVFSPSVGLRLELEGTGEELEVLFKQKIIEQREGLAGNGIEAATAQTSETGLVRPVIWLLSNGEMSAFSMTLFDRGNPDSQVIIIGDELGRIKIAKDQTTDDQDLYE
ncbi:MAG: prepilin-type N-terminal cleavage/methylation domain-containing protein [Oceanicoccus sp.]